MLCRVMIVTNNLVTSPMVTSNANLESFGLQVALPRKIVKEANKSKKKFCSCGLLNSELGGFSCNACYEYLKIRFRDEDFDQV